MNLFGFEIKKKSYYRSPLTAELEGGNYVYYLDVPGVSGSSRTRQVLETDTPQGQALAYKFCSPVSTIISKKVSAFNNAKLEVVNKKGEPAQGAIAERVRALLKTPNPVQGWKQFQGQALSYLNIFGEVFIYKLKPSPASSTIAALYILPNEFVRILTTGKLYLQSQKIEVITGYELRIPGQEVLSFALNEIVHIKDNMASTVTPLQGFSRLVPLYDQVVNIIAAYESRNVLITKRGAIGILSSVSKDSMGAFPLQDAEQERLQTAWRSYGTMKDNRQVIMTKASLTWQSMTFPTKDMMLFEEIEDDVREISNSFGYPPGLLNFKNLTSLSGGSMITELNKQLYQDTTIPEYGVWVDALNEMFGLDASVSSIVFSFEHLPIFQQDEKQKAEIHGINTTTAITQYQAGLITLNDVLSLIDMPEVPNGDVYAGEGSTQPLAVQIGVGGTAALQLILADVSLSENQKRNALMILFGISEQDARLLTQP